MRALDRTNGHPPNPAFARLKTLARRDDGSMAVFSVFVFFAMLLVGGLAIDMMRHENERIRMQNTADRAVLAATMLRANVSEATPQQLVEAYFAAEGLSPQLAGRVVVGGDNETGRTVTVIPAASVPSLFMRLLGVNDFAIVTPAQATEAVSGGVQIELVMVLDVSGSMGGSNKIGTMRNAAIDLTNTLLADNADGSVAVTIVPYAASVLPPAGFLNHFTNLTGTSGACADWSVWNVISNSLSQPISRNSCSTSSWRTVRPYLHDPVVTAGYINALVASGTTSIDLGLRNGALFFDETLQPIISQMIVNGSIDPVFQGRPYAWNTPGLVRALILLTDGENCCGERMPTLVQDVNTLATCTALKAQGILIYSIAFQAPTSGAALMRACASSSNHYFNADTSQLAAAFQGIGANIQTQALRLTY